MELLGKVRKKELVWSNPCWEEIWIRGEIHIRLRIFRLRIFLIIVRKIQICMEKGRLSSSSPHPAQDMKPTQIFFKSIIETLQ